MSTKPTDVIPVATSLYFLPVETRIPLKFGAETVTHITCARVKLKVRNSAGKTAEGWGETPLSVSWVWPGALQYDDRQQAMMEFCQVLAGEWASFGESGHAMEVGHAFIQKKLRALLDTFNAGRVGLEPMPYLASLVCCSAFDIALHDAYGIVNHIPVYHSYTSKYMNSDLSSYITPAEDSSVSFEGKFPADYFVRTVPEELVAWHLVGGKDLIHFSEQTGAEPVDGYPVLLSDWIAVDGLKCLKVKLRGDNSDWDFDRLVVVGQLALKEEVDWLSADFNCMVSDPGYVNHILDRLMLEYPRVYGMLLYVEQPFPYELEENPIDVHSVSSRKPLFMDESAHDWQLVKHGRQLGWNGVALKTCKTQTGAILSLCWAKAHGMGLMVQDLTNPMLAQIPHVLLAAHAGTIMGVETNAMQFYPDASLPEAKIHPGLYSRTDGVVNLATISGAGFGYREDEIRRDLPTPAVTAGEWG
jgi:L-alanine-DL-glutamate epimerase-like enolase superfamily enzyme